jgi:hypothetical protein
MSIATQPLDVHRLAARVMGVDLSHHLRDDVTLTGTPELWISRHGGVDVTAEFMVDPPQVQVTGPDQPDIPAGKGIIWRKKAAEADEQRAGAYIVSITCDAGNEVVHATCDLIVRAKGDVMA